MAQLCKPFDPDRALVERLSLQRIKPFQNWHRAVVFLVEDYLGLWHEAPFPISHYVRKFAKFVKKSCDSQEKFFVASGNGRNGTNELDRQLSVIRCQLQDGKWSEAAGLGTEILMASDVLEYAEIYAQRGIMNKWQIICPVVAMALVALAFSVLSGRAHRNYFIRAAAYSVGRDIIEKTNSSHLVTIGPELREGLSRLLASSTGVAAVLSGDEPGRAANGTAFCRLVLTNAVADRIVIRLRPTAKAGEFRFEVLGFTRSGRPVEG